MAGIGSRITLRRDRLNSLLIGSEQALQLPFAIAYRFVLNRVRHFSI